MLSQVEQRDARRQWWESLKRWEGGVASVELVVMQEAKGDAKLVQIQTDSMGVI
jgi:hypothetical protein